MGEPLLRAHQVGAAGVERQRRAGAAQHEVAAHARGEVDHGVDVGAAQPLDHGAVERDVARAAARLRVAHVDVHDRGAGARRVERRVRDLLRRHRDALGAVR